MEMNDFLQNFSSLFEETDIKAFTPDAQFRSFPEWSSLKAMSLIAMLDMNYRVKFTGKDIRNCQTIGDIFEIAKSRKK